MSEPPMGPGGPPPHPRHRARPPAAGAVSTRPAPPVTTRAADGWDRAALWGRWDPLLLLRHPLESHGGLLCGSGGRQAVRTKAEKQTCACVGTTLTGEDTDSTGHGPCVDGILGCRATCGFYTLEASSWPLRQNPKPIEEVPFQKGPQGQQWNFRSQACPSAKRKSGKSS